MSPDRLDHHLSAGVAARRSGLGRGRRRDHGSGGHGLRADGGRAAAAGFVLGHHRHGAVRRLRHQPPSEDHHQFHHVDHVDRGGRAAGRRRFWNLRGALLGAGDHGGHHHDRPVVHEVGLHLGLLGQVGHDGLYLRRGVADRDEPAAQGLRRAGRAAARSFSSWGSSSPNCLRPIRMRWRWAWARSC